MKVFIKQFDLEMEVKTKGIEFEVRTPGDEFLGDLYLTKTVVTWCAGKTTKEKGVKITWEELMEVLGSEAKKAAAIKAAKNGK